jgi:hypothetical protein
MRAFVVVLLALAGACYQPEDHGFTCGAGGSCPAGQHCAASGRCVADEPTPAPDAGGSSSDAGGCAVGSFLRCEGAYAVTCEAAGAGEVATNCGTAGCNTAAQRCNTCSPGDGVCDGRDLLTCDADGLTILRTTCELGCDAAAAQCDVMRPSNLTTANAAACLAAAADRLEVGTATGTTTVSVAVDTSAAAACDVVDDSVSPGRCIVIRKDIHVWGNGVLRAMGARSLILIAQNHFAVDGRIDASAHRATAGPGAVSTGMGAPPVPLVFGAGGGGYGSPGGSGGRAPMTIGGTAPGGAAYGTPALVPIVGGSPGGSVSFAQGGAGGGAVQLSLCRGTLSLGATAVIDAGGGGAGGGSGVSESGASMGGGGGGGGSGGAILIEAPQLYIAGELLANGGGGGGGGSWDNEIEGSAGGNGGENGGAGGVDYTLGGLGAALGHDAASGKSSANLLFGGAGGGGGVGRIRVNIAAGAMVQGTPKKISPACPYAGPLLQL